MEENLVGYLLNNLDAATHDRVESELRSDPHLRQRLELLRQALAPLEEDREVEAPADLTFKTLGYVAEYCCRELPHAPQPVTRPAPSSTPYWRRVDVLVAASILFAVITLGFPLVLRARAEEKIQECKNNFSEWYRGVSTYRDVHKKPPNIAAKESPRNVAGAIAPTLHDVLPKTASICCPAMKGFVPCTLSQAQVDAFTNEEFKQEAPRLLPCYAWSLGYRDDHGVYHCAMESQEETASARIPLMADRPPPTGMGNSLNHGGYGQNVLFNDGHVEFMVSRNFAGDDIYLNRRMEVAAGIGCNDTVLGSSASRP